MKCFGTKVNRIFLSQRLMGSHRLRAVRLSFFCSPSSKTQDTQMATRVTDGARRPRFACPAASPLPRACIALTKSEEKERRTVRSLEITREVDQTVYTLVYISGSQPS